MPCHPFPRTNPLILILYHWAFSWYGLFVFLPPGQLLSLELTVVRPNFYRSPGYLFNFFPDRLKSKKGGKIQMKKNAFFGIFFIVLFLVSSSVFGAGEPKWSQKIKWNKPKPWAERLKGVELAPEIPQAFIDKEPWLKDQPKKTVAVGGYIWPEGWQEAVKGVKSLSFFNFGGLPHDPAIGIAMAAFEAKTGIEIHAQAMEELGLWLKTVAAMTARRSVPQLLHNTPLTSLSHIAAAGWAENLDFFWPEEVQKLYGDGAVSSCKVDDHFWASGFVSVKPFVLFYRPSILKEATGSAEPPKTYQELLTKAKMVAEKTDKYGLAIPGKDYRYVWYQMSGPLYSMGGRFIKDGKFDVTSADYKEMFRYWVDLVKEGAVPKEALGWSWTDAPEVFARGRAAMLIAGPVNATRFKDNPPAAIKGDWDFRPQLAWKEGDIGITSIGTIVVWSVNKYASEAEKAASILFLDFYRSFQSQWNEIGFEGNECAVPAMYDMESIKKAIYKPEVSRESVQKTYGESLPVNGDQMIKYEHEWWARAATGEVSIEEALKNLANDIAAISP